MTSAIERLCCLANELRRSGKSVHRLVEESGIHAELHQFTERAILDVLRSAPELVADWLGYSQDKRTSGGWYLIEEDNNRYVVGAIDGERVGFDDANAACASFIIREFDSMVNRRA